MITGSLNNGIVMVVNRYFVGVLDKSTMHMNVHNAQLFNMLPLIPGKYGTFVMYDNSGITVFFRAFHGHGKLLEGLKCSFSSFKVINYNKVY